MSSVSRVPIALQKRARRIAVQTRYPFVTSPQKRSIDAIARKVDVGPWSGKGLVKTAKSKTGIELGTYLHPGGHEYPTEGAAATIELFRRVGERD